MASDDTRPKVRMLLTIGIVAVTLLVGVKFVLDSYFLEMTESHERSLIPPTEQLDKVRAEERANIEKGQNGNIPVSVAMQQLSQSGRDNIPLITPTQSDDVDPLKGWTKLKHDVHLPPQLGATTTTGPEQPTINVTVGDAGVQTTTAKDGGAPAPNAPKDGGVAAPKDAGAALPHAPQQHAKDGGK